MKNWYKKMNFKQTYAYYHLFFEENEMKLVSQEKVAKLHPVTIFAHYEGEDLGAFKDVKRKHQCVCYVMDI